MLSLDGDRKSLIFDPDLTSLGSLASGTPKTSLSWVAVKEGKLCHHNPETVLSCIHFMVT